MRNETIFELLKRQEDSNKNSGDDQQEDSSSVNKLKKFLRANHSQLFVEDRNGRTALHVVAEKGRLAAASVLVQSGALLHVYDQAGRVPFHAAVKHGQLEMARYLLEAGTFPHVATRSEDTALHLSADSGSLEMSKWLISIGASMNYKNRDGDTPLHKAAMNGNIPVMKVMLEFGASHSVVNNSGATPFHKAAGWGHLSAVQLLYDKGANISHINYRGDSSLHAAAAGGSLEVVKWLLLKGADAYGENLCGQTPYDVARTDRIKNILMEVQEKGLGAIYNKAKETPDELAARRQEELKIRSIMEEEYKEEIAMSARCALEKELNLLAKEHLSGRSNQVCSNSSQANGYLSDKNSEHDGNLCNDIGSSVSALDNLIEQAKSNRDGMMINTGLNLNGVAPLTSCASGVTDTAGTTIVGHRSDDTLSDHSFNDSMLSQNSTDFWNERANFYLERMKNFARKFEDYSSSGEESDVQSNDGCTLDHTDADAGATQSIGVQVESLEDEEERSTSSAGGTTADDGDDDVNSQERMSLDRMIEIQDEELKSLKAQQEEMREELQRAQQDEVDQELLALSQSMSSDADDTLPVSEVKMIKKRLDEKHSAQLAQLWKDHQISIDAMKESHRFERMAFSMDSSDKAVIENEYEGQTIESGVPFDNRDEIAKLTEKEHIAKLESDIVALRDILRKSGVSPSGFQPSPSGITSVKEEVIDEKPVDESIPEGENDDELLLERGEVASGTLVVEEVVMIADQENFSEMSEVVLADNTESANKDDDSTGGAENEPPREAKKKKRVLSPEKKGVKLLASGNLAAGLGITAIRSLVGGSEDESSSESESEDSASGDSSEEDEEEDEEEELTQKKGSKGAMPSSSLRESGVERESAPEPRELPTDEEKTPTAMLNDAPDTQSEPVEVIPEKRESSELKEVSTASVDVKTPQTYAVTSPLTSSTKKPSPGQMNTRRMASGELAAGLGGVCMLSFMQGSDDDLSTNDNESRATEDTKSVKPLETVTENRLLRDAKDEPDCPSVSEDGSSSQVQNNGSEEEPEWESSCEVPSEYKVHTIYNLSPSKSSPLEENDVLDHEKQISLLEANIAALNKLLGDGETTQSNALSSRRPDPEDKDMVRSDNEKFEEELRLVEEVSSKVFNRIDLNNDGLVTKIELIKGLRNDGMNLREVLNLPAHIRQEDGSRDSFMMVFHSMDRDNSSDISLPEFVDFCQKVHRESASHVLPTIEESSAMDNNTTVSSPDQVVEPLKAAAGQAISATVDMLKKVVEDGGLMPTPDNTMRFLQSNADDDDEDDSSDSHSGNLTPRATPRVLTPSLDINQVDLTKFTKLAEKLSILASCLLSESRASKLRELSSNIRQMIDELESEAQSDDTGWTNVGEKVSQLTRSCRQWKVDALAIVRAEIIISKRE